MGVRDFEARANQKAGLPVSGTRYAFGTGAESSAEEIRSQGCAFIRLPRRGKLELVLLSGEVVTYAAHFHRRLDRLVPHEVEECPYCVECGPPRIRWVFCMFDASDGRVGLFEVGATGADPILTARAEGKQLVGLIFEFWRDGERINGAHRCRARGRWSSEDLLPEPLPIRQKLIQIWDRIEPGPVG